MGVLSGSMIRQRKIITPHFNRTERRWRDETYSFGESIAGYDIRVEFDSEGKLEYHKLSRGCFCLASTIEHFSMPKDVIGIVHDKSSWARRGLTVQNTVIEPGWRGFLTLELHNQSIKDIVLEREMPIAQVVFHTVEGVVIPYDGKYQDQERGPQSAR